MHQRTRFHVFSVIPCLALSLLAQDPAPQAAAPAGPAVKIAAHQSRWDYPREMVVPAGMQIHYVQKGDTLWDLGTKYLGNPFAWPQIWELNKWITDPHWIFPGDPLLVDASRGTVPQAGDRDLAPQEVADLQPDLRRVVKPSRDEYAYSFQDFIQLPFIADQGTEAYIKKSGALKIVGRQDATKDMQGDGDVVYLNGGTNQGFKAGDRLVAWKTQARKFYHPDDRIHRKPMGDIIQQCGVLRLTSAYPTQSIAVIERSLDGITMGQYASPFAEPANIVSNLRTDIGDPVKVKPPTAKIVYIREDRAVAGSGDLLIIDRGSADGLHVGDILLAVRSLRLDSTSSKAADQDRTNIYVGQIVVVRTEEHTASCRLTRSKTEIMVGDNLTR
jgi:hypothetical protein